MSKSMVHLNNHLLCATDCETTGLVAGHHEIWHVCFLPLDENLDLSKTDRPFDLYIRPLYPERADVPPSRFAPAMENGIDPVAAFELFEHWFDSLNLPERKRIVLLGQNLPFDIRFYIEWMGHENFNHYVDSRGRDCMMLAQMMNDRATFHAQQIPYPNSVTLSRLATRCGIQVEEPYLHDATYDAALAARVYKKMLIDVLDI